MNEKNLLPGMCRDRNPGQGVQPWSAGDIYPLVIERVEQYAPESFSVRLDGQGKVYTGKQVLVGTYWNVLNAGDGMSGYATYDEARAGALGYLAWVEGERAEAHEREIERLSQPEPGYGGRFCDAGGAFVDPFTESADNGNGSGVV